MRIPYCQWLADANKCFDHRGIGCRLIEKRPTVIESRPLKPWIDEKNMIIRLNQDACMIDKLNDGHLGIGCLVLL